ncbi:MAG TPA: efflux RND transporter periplasmic adaptor subunit [Candidatus Paceibacterota bacterium]
MRKIINHFKNRKGFYFLLLIVVLAVAWFVFGGKKQADPSTLQVKRGNIIQEVSVTGKVTPDQEISLAFERGGRIRSVYVKVGDRVSPGQSLVALDTSELQAQLSQAQASVDSQTAKLDELKRGSRTEDIQAKKTDLAKAQQDLTNYYRGISDVIQDSYIKADDAIRKQIDALFSNDEDSNVTLVFQTASSQTKTNAEGQRYAAGLELRKWLTELNQFYQNSTATEQDKAILTASQKNLEVIRGALTVINSAVVDASGVNSTTLTEYRTSINTARTNVASALSAVNTRTDVIASQEFVVTGTNDELNKMLSGSDPEVIKAQEAQVAQARANVELIQAQLAKTVLRAPLGGVITKQDAKQGAITATNVNLVSMIAGSLLIEVNIPEVDIAKVKIGDSVAITLDAYGENTKFSGKVTSVDPSETIVEGVATYKTKIFFSQKYEQAKPGMTANLDILTDKKDNVLVIPQRSVKTEDGKKIVMLPVPDQTTGQEREIVTGLRGSDGNIEVVSGLEEGEIILSSPE